jgi:hypothetical protein
VGRLRDEGLELRDAEGVGVLHGLTIPFRG